MATEFNKLVGYLRKMGLTYNVQAADGYNKISYTDDQGNDAQVEYTKVITIDSPESAKTHYPQIDLWYIPSLDRFVEHGSATNGETNALQADTARDILDYIGYVYWEMSEDEMKKQLESKKNEDSARPYMNRLYCLVEQGYLDWATIGEFLARGLSEDMVEKAYGWMKQDELIPTDDALAEDGLEWDEDGELVSIENDDADESKKPSRTRLDAFLDADTRLASLERKGNIVAYDTHKDGADFSVILDADKTGKFTDNKFIINYLGLDPNTVTLVKADTINNAKSYAKVNNLVWLRNLIEDEDIHRIYKVALDVKK